MRSIPGPKDDPEQAPVLGINYGLERSGFLPRCGSIRNSGAGQTLLTADLKDQNTLQLIHRVTVEIDGEQKPACVAD